MPKLEINLYSNLTDDIPIVANKLNSKVIKNQNLHYKWLFKLDSSAVELVKVINI